MTCATAVPTPPARPPALRVLDREILEAVADGHHRGLRAMAASGIAADLCVAASNGAPPVVVAAVAQLLRRGLLERARGSGRGMRYRLTQAGWTAAGRRPPSEEARDRSCLGCGKTFFSAGRHNRLCEACNRRAAADAGALL